MEDVSLSYIPMTDAEEMAFRQEYLEASSGSPEQKEAFIAHCKDLLDNEDHG